MDQVDVPFTLTIQSRKNKVSLNQGDLLLELRLASTYLFASPHYTRLLGVTGITESVFVFTSFVPLTPFDSTYRRLLGLSTSTPGAVVPVEGNFISALGEISLAKLDGSSFEKLPEENIVIHIQIATAEWLY